MSEPITPAQHRTQAGLQFTMTVTRAIADLNRQFSEASPDASGWMRAYWLRTNRVDVTVEVKKKFEAAGWEVKLACDQFQIREKKP